MEEPTTQSQSIDMAGYRAAFTGPVYHFRDRSGPLQIHGPDRLDFLQRQTTNDLRRLEPPQAVVTVLTSPKARILDVLTLVIEEDHLMALTLPGRGPTTAAYLKSRIFFMDKVTLVDADDNLTSLDLEGTAISDVLNGMGFASAPPIDRVERADLEGTPLWAIGRAGLLGLGTTLIFPAAARNSVNSLLENLGCFPLSPEEYEILRVEAGLPGPQAELTDQYTPLEVGIPEAVASDKGCYTGQEVLARQLTYDKVTQQMVGLRLPSTVRPGDRITVDGRQAGIVTSSAVSPQIGPIALAVIRRPFHETGQEVEVGEGVITAKVSDLPFNR